MATCREYPPPCSYCKHLTVTTHYTTFKYQNLRVTPERAPVGQEINVAVDVVNTGKRAGEEVVQLYLSTGNLQPALPMPVKQLKGFKKLAIAPGETNRVTFKLTSNDLYIFDATAGRYRVPTGDYMVRIGGASDNLPLSRPFNLSPASELPDLMVTNIRTLPAFPQPGDRVLFLASVLNRGTGPTPVDKAFSVSFSVNSQVIARSPELRRSIPAGGMAMVCGSEALEGPFQWTIETKAFSVQAEADFRGDIQETIESNNISSLTYPRSP